jgi:hypothetical protein
MLAISLLRIDIHFAEYPLLALDDYLSSNTVAESLGKAYGNGNCVTGSSSRELFYWR